MEKYEFVANNEDTAVEAIDAQQLRQYIKDCDLLAQKIAESIEQKTNNGINIEKLSEVLNRQPDNNQTLLNLLINLYKNVFDENRNPIVSNKTKVREILNNLSNESLEYDLSFDALNKIGSNGRLMRSILDIVNENNQRNISITELNPTPSIMAAEVLHNMGYFFHYPLVVDYTIATKGVKELPQDIQQSGYKLVEWDVTKSSLPTLSAQVELLVYRDSINDLPELNSESLVAEISANVKDNGFLLAVFRTQLSSAETLLNQLMGIYDRNHIQILIYFFLVFR